MAVRMVKVEEGGVDGKLLFASPAYTIFSVDGLGPVTRIKARDPCIIDLPRIALVKGMNNLVKRATINHGQRVKRRTYGAGGLQHRQPTRPRHSSPTHQRAMMSDIATNSTQISRPPRIGPHHCSSLAVSRPSAHPWLWRASSVPASSRSIASA